MPRLRVITVNDVYEIDHLPSLATAKKEAEADPKLDRVICVLPGDFVAPSLLSSLDSGRGMVHCLNSAGLDYACIGNHESDIEMKDLNKRREESEFTWINSNIPNFPRADGLPPMPEYCVIEVGHFKVALLGLCGEDRSVMKPGAFGGADITPLNESLLSWCERLSLEVDLIIPLTHQLIGADRETAKLIAKTKEAVDLVPCLVAAHDHEPFLEEVNGVKIIKVGQNADHIGFITFEWSDDAVRGSKPAVTMEMKEAKAFAGDLETAKVVEQHKQVLTELEKSILFPIPKMVPPFSSQGIRLRPTSVGTYLCTIVREELGADLCMLGAGCIRAQRSYDGEEGFSYAMLKSEFAFPTVVARVKLPGRVVAEMVSYTRSFALEDPPIAKGGYLQTCDRFLWNGTTNTIEELCGEPVGAEKMYTCVFNYQIMQGMDNVKPLMDYKAGFPTTDKNMYPDQDACIDVKHAIVSYFSSRALFHILHSFHGNLDEIDANQDGKISRAEFRAYFSKRGSGATDIILDNLFAICDVDGDGFLTKDEILNLAVERLRFKKVDGRPYDRLSVEEVMTLLRDVVGDLGSIQPMLEALDKDGDGYITRGEINDMVLAAEGTIRREVKSVFV